MGIKNVDPQRSTNNIKIDLFKKESDKRLFRYLPNNSYPYLMGYDRNTIGIGYLLIILVSADISVSLIGICIGRYEKWIYQWLSVSADMEKTISFVHCFHFKFSSCCLLPLEKWANRSSKNKSNLSTYYIGSGQKKNVPIIFSTTYIANSFWVLRALQKEVIL